MDFGNDIVVLLKLRLQFSSVKLAVATTSLDDLGLLLNGKVRPLEVGSDDVFEKLENLVVRDGARVGEVVDACLLVLCQYDGGWEEIVEDSVRVGDINNLFVLGDLGDEVTGV